MPTMSKVPPRPPPRPQPLTRMPPRPPPALPFLNDNPSWPRFDAFAAEGSQSSASEDGFSVVDESGADEVADVVQDFYEGPRTCQCCINWVEGVPKGLEEELTPEPHDEDEGCPILVRRIVSGGGSRLYKVHSIEIHSAPLRALLVDVFSGYDSLLRGFKHLTFLAPFRPFFWRWNQFERAIKEQEDESLLKSLKTLRRIVKSELGNVFTSNKEMLEHKVVFSNLVWTLFKPGDLVYSKLDGNDQFFRLQYIETHGGLTSLHCQYIDYNGHDFGVVSRLVEIGSFLGTRKITDLEVIPASFLDDFEGMKKRMIQRGRRFQELTGINYKSYRPYNSSVHQTSIKEQVGTYQLTRTIFRSFFFEPDV
jgi:hypothetical protein